ncbi:hypothetical protein TIFTF001_048065, partial [Ficus carica]
VLLETAAATALSISSLQASSVFNFSTRPWRLAVASIGGGVGGAPYGGRAVSLIFSFSFASLQVPVI